MMNRIYKCVIVSVFVGVRSRNVIQGNGESDLALEREPADLKISPETVNDGSVKQLKSVNEDYQVPYPIVEPAVSPTKIPLVPTQDGGAKLRQDFLSCEHSPEKSTTNAKTLSGCYKAPSGLVETETEIEFVFVRHAESMWNNQKTMSKRYSEINHLPQSERMQMKPGNAKCDVALKEAFDHSSYVRFETGAGGGKDVALSALGVAQADALRQWIETNDTAPAAGSCFVAPPLANIRCSAEASDPRNTARNSLIAILEDKQTVFATSNLRRALLTMLIAFNSRLNAQKRKVHILSALQEVSSQFALDARSLALPGTPPALGENDTTTDRIGKNCPFKNDFLSNVLNAQCNLGDRNTYSGFAPTGARRMNDFCKWVGQQVVKGMKNLVVVGHSSWYQKFIKTHLTSPQSENPGNECDKALTKSGVKLGNASMTRAKLVVYKNGSCKVKAHSTTLVFGGFSDKHKASKSSPEDSGEPKKE